MAMVCLDKRTSAMSNVSVSNILTASQRRP